MLKEKPLITGTAFIARTRGSDNGGRRCQKTSMVEIDDVGASTDTQVATGMLF